MLFHIFVGMSVDGFMATPDNAPVWGHQFDSHTYGYDDAFIQVKASPRGFQGLYCGGQRPP
jgi:hypothetical protein